MKSKKMLLDVRVINGEFASRYIASWLRAGGKLYYHRDIENFHEWLLSMGIEEDDVRYIVDHASCGKLEFQESAKAFLSNK